MKTTQKTSYYQEQLQALDTFYTAFTVAEAQRLLHVMFRSAFARQNSLSKKDVLDLLFMKEEMGKLLVAACVLADSPANKPLLKRFFRWRKLNQWMQALDDLFYAAVYDGIYANVPAEQDIYHACRGLLALVTTCRTIYDRDKHQLKN